MTEDENEGSKAG